MISLLNEKFSTRAKNALKTAQKISRELNRDHIGTEHLLYGIIAEPSSFVTEVILKNRISPATVHLELVRRNLNEPAVKSPVPSAPLLKNDLKRALEIAAVTAAKHQYPFIGTEHFLYGIVDSESNPGQNVLKTLKLDPEEIKKNLLSVFENASRFPEVANFKEFRELPPEEVPFYGNALESFTIDLTDKAKAGRLDPLIGREAEVERLVSILNRRTKNNPVLIGDPGVGKTAIVEGLALKIHRREVPENLWDKKILSLDLAQIVAGSMFRGEFESRLKQVIEEIRQAGNVILFIDELHTVVGAGSASGSLDAANILKPSLARGELRAIGATTLGEYKKHIEADAALERRFHPILVREPGGKETLTILYGLKPYYESHHGVEFTDDSLETAVKLSSRYLTDRFLPDKAIDLLDETAAFARSKTGLTAPDPLALIERELTETAEQKTHLILVHRDFGAAQKLKKQEDELLLKRQKLLESRSSEETPKPPPLQITGDHVAKTVARITNIPVIDLKEGELKKLASLEARLGQQIIGQEMAIKTIASAIRRSSAGIASHDRPLGSFMFLGPSGVGKTLSAKVLAQEIFDDAEALIRIDMSELMERHNVARLVGSPPGYVGYGEGGRLTEAVRRRPYSVVLFDEIEKAHPEALDLLLQILEDGELTDAQGKKVNFRNTLLIMTSNIGTSSLKKWTRRMGFAEEKAGGSETWGEPEEIKSQIRRELKERLRLEFLNRVDKIVIFEPLSRESLQKIVKLELEKLGLKLAEQGLLLKTSEAVTKLIASLSFDPEQGARLVRKNLQDLAEDPIAQAILENRGKNVNQTALRLSADKKTIKIEIA